MKSCCCSLPALRGHKVCITCTNKESSIPFDISNETWKVLPEAKIRIIEKFDENGNIIERITEEI